MYDGNLPSFDPTLIDIDGLVAADLGVLEIYRLLLVDEELDVVLKRALISLQGENVIRFLVDDRLRDIAQPLASIVTIAPSIANMRNSLGMAMISLDFPDLHLTENPPLARGEKPTRCGSDPRGLFFLEVFEPDRRTVLPSTATTSAGTPVCAKTQATKQRSNGSGSSVARMSQVVVRRRSIHKGSEAS